MLGLLRHSSRMTFLQQYTFMEEDQFPLAMLVAPQNGWPTNTVDGQALRCHTVGAFGRGAPYGLSQIQWDKPTVDLSTRAIQRGGKNQPLKFWWTKEEIMIDHRAKFIEIEWKLGSKINNVKMRPKTSQHSFRLFEILAPKWEVEMDPDSINESMVNWWFGW